MDKLKYGNTNTFFIKGNQGGLLIDTDYHPDHMGLIGQLIEQGAKLLLVDLQKSSVHFSDKIFEKDKLPFSVINEADAVIISCEESRRFLSAIGISGEIVHTPSHSDDSISLILDDGSCFVGDLDPIEYIEAYENNTALKNDWDLITSYNPKIIYYAHRPGSAALYQRHQRYSAKCT